MEQRYCMKCMRPTGGTQMCPYCGHVAGETTLAAHVLRPGTILDGRYILGEPLGQGGFGITYIGRDRNLDIRVAIKEYFPSGYAIRNVETSDSITITDERLRLDIQKGKDSFLKEARTLAQFKGTPGIVDVLNFFEANDTAYIVMEYLDGETLAHRLKRELFTADEIFRLMEPVFDTLEKIHQQGVVHRDISPDNIMMLPDGRLKLMDFGAARLMNYSDQRSVSVVLKAGYAPLEQYSTKGEQGPWTDIYALCATIYKSITKITPPDAHDRLMGEEIRWPSELGIPIPIRQEAVLKKGMEIRQKDRIQSIGELQAALREETSGSAEFGPITWKPLPEDATVALPKEQSVLPMKQEPNKEATSKTTSDTGLPHNERKAEAKQPGNKKKPAYIWAVCALLGVALIAALFFILLGGKSKQGTEEKTTAVTAEATVKGELTPAPSPTETTSWSVLGSICGTMWDTDFNMTEVEPRVWKSDPLELKAGDEFKIRLNKDWTTNYGLDGDSNAIKINEKHGIVRDGLNVMVETEGIYVVILNLNSNTITVADDTARYNSWGVIGNFGGTSWDTDFPMTEQEPGVWVSEPLELKAGEEFKVRANREWGMVYGISDGKTIEYGDNVRVEADGIYRITLNLNTVDLFMTEHQANTMDTPVPKPESTPAPTITLSAMAAKKTIAAGIRHTVGLKNDGTVVAVGKNDMGQCSIRSWRNMVAVAAGGNTTVGLKSNGTVQVTGETGYGQEKASDWKDIVDIAVGEDHVVGLKSDGSVVAVGNNQFGQCDVSGWQDIIAVAAGQWFTVGLRSDGSVISVGYNSTTDGISNVSYWDDIVDIAAGIYHIVGLRSDGTLEAVGTGGVYAWTDIVVVAAGGENTVGIKSDGTVVATGNNRDGQCEVSDWEDIVAIAANAEHTVGIKSDGTAVAIGWNGQGRCDVSDWKDIRVPEKAIRVSEKQAVNTPFKMPDLTGMTVEDANNILSMLDLKQGEITEEHSDSFRVGQIIRQTPGGGEDVRKGDSISFVTAIKDPWFYRFNIGEQDKDLLSKARSFVNESKDWQSKTDCPQSIEQIPLLPAGFLNLYADLMKAESTLSHEGSQYVWRTNAGTILPPPTLAESVDYSHGVNHVYSPIKFNKQSEGVFAFPDSVLLSDVDHFSISRQYDVKDLYLSVDYNNYLLFDEINASTDLSVFISSSLYEDFAICWACGNVNGFSKKGFVLQITYGNEHRYCYLSYDYETGKLIEADFQDF